MPNHLYICILNRDLCSGSLLNKKDIVLVKTKILIEFHIGFESLLYTLLPIEL